MAKVLFFLIAFWQSTALMATTQKPLELKPFIKSTSSYGETKLTKLFWDVYDISLWTDADVWSPDEPYAITINYLTSFTTEQLVDATIEEMKRLKAPFNTESYRKKLEKFFPNVKEGDRVTAYFKPGSEVIFFYNGSKRGAVTNGNFVKYFSDIWLSSETSEPEARAALLKQSQNEIENR